MKSFNINAKAPHHTQKRIESRFIKVEKSCRRDEQNGKKTKEGDVKNSGNYKVFFVIKCLLNATYCRANYKKRLVNNPRHHTASEREQKIDKVHYLKSFWRSDTPFAIYFIAVTVPVAQKLPVGVEKFIILRLEPEIAILPFSYASTIWLGENASTEEIAVAVTFLHCSTLIE
jgi:hypothetical protein